MSCVLDPQSLKGAVFDCDGVILDSNAIKAGTYAELLAGEPAFLIRQFADYRDHHAGLPRRQLLTTYYKDLAGAPDWEKRVEAAALRFGELTRAALRDCPIIAGVEAAIDRFGRAHVPCVVVSAADRDDVAALLAPRGLADGFRTICGGDRGKADHVRALLGDGTIATPLVFFGDSALDMEAAEATGCRFVFVAGASEWIGGRAVVDQHGHEAIEDFTALSWA